MLCNLLSNEAMNLYTETATGLPLIHCSGELYHLKSYFKSMFKHYHRGQRGRYGKANKATSTHQIYIYLFKCLFKNNQIFMPDVSFYFLAFIHQFVS